MDNKSITTVTDDMSFITKPIPVTEERLQCDFNYYVAQKMLEKLLGQGLISDDEFNKITALNREKFSPYLAEIMA